MNSRDLSRLMWNEALSMLEQADRLHRQFFQPAAAQAPAWEPPVDVIESAENVWVQVALPGVDPGSVTVGLELDALTVSAHRSFPRGAGEVRVLEIPYGRFQRRIGLPMQALTLANKRMQDGCLTLTFSRKEST
ncbi:MAG TPA: Hsp20/alpha crystallin family protein [Burkholderiales bacterium]|jgi:HSP20 family protein